MSQKQRQQEKLNDFLLPKMTKSNHHNNNSNKLLNCVEGNQKIHSLNINKTPSPPRLLLSSQKPLLSSLPSSQSQRHNKTSVTKGSLTLFSSFKTPTNETPECDRKLRKLQESGLLAKLNTFQISKNVTLDECEDEDENNDNQVSDFFVF